MIFFSDLDNDIFEISPNNDNRLCIRGTQIPVGEVLEMFSSNLTVTDIANHFQIDEEIIATTVKSLAFSLKC